MANRLASASSPYLLQHAGNPVNWFPWGDEALGVARELDRPLLISVGYSSCHWCHVMAHECFEDSDIARLMNEHFVNIKVDREERPDIDAIYMQALLAMQGSGGWPMTIFALATGEPFYAGTYFPPHDRPGMPGFPTVLRTLAEAYRDRRDELEAAARDARQVMARPAVLADDLPVAEDITAATAKMLARADVRHGGFGGAPKFPQPLALDFLMQRWWSGDAECETAVIAALDAMAAGGLHDHLGGGFHRYCVDADWTVPHFEKMLYDNAQLASTYLRAFQMTGNDRWREVCESTLAYLAAEMRTPDGGFAASQDADSPEGEGSFYMWTLEQMSEALGESDATWACEVFGISESVNVLSRRRPARDLERLRSVSLRMAKLRDKRTRPARDDKIITAWNALAISALAEASAALATTHWLELATTAAEFIVDTLVDDRHRVLRSWRAGKVSGLGFLEDAALLANALLTLYDATGDAAWFLRARAVAEQAREDFRDPDLGYCDTSQEAAQLIVRPRTLDDGALPSGQSAMARLAIRLFGLTEDQSWLETAGGILRPLKRTIVNAPFAVPNAASAADWLVCGVREVALAGPKDSVQLQDLLRTLRENHDPYRVVAWGGGEVPLLADRGMIEGVPSAYVCRDFVCQRPVTDPGALLDVLRA